MNKSNIIFGSKSELYAYEAIDKHLPNKWRLYANTPLSQIVEISKNELPEKQWDFYLKSSVDFVLTNDLHEPVLAIEFDGLGDGYSSGKKYIINQEIKIDPYRELKMNFKINTCYKVGLPLIVISLEELRNFGDTEFLSIVNSIVAKHITSLEYKETIEQWDREGRGNGKTFDEILWDDSRLRTKLSFQNDPFLAQLEKDGAEFDKLSISYSMTSLSKPDQLTAMKEEKTFHSVGCRYSANGDKLRKSVNITVWIRNFMGDEFFHNLDPSFIPSHGINPLAVAHDIAWYLGQKNVLKSVENYHT